MSALAVLPLSSDHRDLLRWFEERAGQISGFPKRLPDGRFLVSAPKGIYKPADLPYALSVRVNLHSRYSDGKRIDRPDQSWAFAYHQENPDVTQRDREYTNRALMRCIEDGVPVGVLFERDRLRGRSQYDVLGLALPVDWREGYFLFEGFGPDGPVRDADTYADVLLGSVLDGDADSAPDDDDGASVPGEDYDGRLRAMRSIVARQGQQRFRAELLRAYAGRCAISGEGVKPILDAAHIRPYRGPASNVITNGLLLRTDLHSLFDLQLCAVEPVKRTVVLSKTLHASTYASLHGTALREPIERQLRPSASVLEYVWAEFLAAERGRDAV